MKIAWISRKGSVGKTTTAVNLAASLAGRGRKVLMVDLDDQASASLSLGVGRRHLAPSLADVLLRGLPMAQVIRETSVENLYLVTGSVDLCFLEDDLGATRRPERCLRGPLASVQESFDTVLLDCPAGLGLLPRAALVAADVYALGLTPQFLVLDGLENFLEKLERQRFHLASKARLLGLLLTQVDYRTRTTRPYVQQIREQFGDKVLETEIRINVRLAEAPSYGQTIFQYAPDSSGAKGYWQLGEEVLRRWNRALGDRSRSARQAQEASGRRDTGSAAAPPSPTPPSSSVAEVRFSPMHRRTAAQAREV